MDELNSAIGAARAFGTDKRADSILEPIQHQLFTVGAEIASQDPLKGPKIENKHTMQLEDATDIIMEGVGETRSFLLPGGTQAGALLHVARAVCRRAERSVAALAQEEAMRPELVMYLNRLSTLLYALARKANKGLEEKPPVYDLPAKH